MAHSVAAFRHTFRRARALRFWRVGGVSLIAAGALGLGVQLTVPPTTSIAAQLSGTFSLSDVSSTVAGAKFNGIADNDYSGASVSGAGDVNGDGLDDLLIGATGADLGGYHRGQSYLVYGQPTGTPLTGTLNLSNVGGTLVGAKFNGIADSDYSGFSVSGAGDVNGDGLDDLLIGAIFADAGGYDRGESYLVYGQPTGTPLTGTLNLADVGGTLAGATFNGIANIDYSGISVSSAGDVNGDGLDDLVIGAHFASAGGFYRGQSYLVYGQPTGSPLTGTLKLADVGGTLAGARFNGIADDDYSGYSVSSAGDVNGDGLDDLLIGAYFSGAGGFYRGQSYLVYGQPTGSPLTGTLKLADVGGAVAGATFNGIADGDFSGNSVSSAGDVNGDGLDDLLIGANLADSGGLNRGQSYLVYGQPTGSPLTGTLNLSDVGGAVAGATFNGIADVDHSGDSVSGAGDVNGDGLDDLLIGAKWAAVGSNRGQSYLVYGQPASSPLAGSLNLADVGGAVAGATFNGIANGDFSGNSVSSAGDVNGDGLDDLLIGANLADSGGYDRGQSYLVYGQRSAAACDFTGSSTCGLADINLMMAQGNLVAGVSVSAGNQFDLNSDNIINNLDMTDWLKLAGANNGYGGGDPNDPNAPYLRGDTNDLDNLFSAARMVDITDFTNFLTGFTGSCVNWECGNFNGDNVVDITDFSIHFLPNFSATGGGTYGPGQSIPEPSTMVLLGIGGVLLGYISNTCNKRGE